MFARHTTHIITPSWHISGVKNIVPNRAGAPRRNGWSEVGIWHCTANSKVKACPHWRLSPNSATVAENVASVNRA